MCFALLILFSTTCHGFLLPTTPTFQMSDKHFNILMDLYINERQTRRKLETQVSQLQSDMNTIKQCGCGVTTMSNKENSVATVSRQEFIEMKAQYLKLQKEVSGLKQNDTTRADELAISTLENQTRHLQEEIQATNRRQASVISNANIRKQNINGLYRRVVESERNIRNLNDSLSNKSLEIYQTLERNHMIATNSTHLIETRLFNKVSTIEKRIHQLELTFYFNSSRIVNQMQGLQSKTLSIQNALDTMSDRALFTAACQPSTPVHVAANQVIPFTTVVTSHGISDVSSLRNNGIFIVEKEGFYLISCFISSNSTIAYFSIDRNNNVIANPFMYSNSNWKTVAAVTTSHLHVGDTVRVRSILWSSDVKSGVSSEFTVIQII